MSAQAYRRDIDGLRAIAVLAVVLYHYDLGSVRGGFVGVDIFFVISGFLITGIIQREIADGAYSYAAFYERRVRRLFPALFVVLAVTMAVGVALLLPSDLRTLGTSVPATLFFGSNVFFWRSSGYFDVAAELNPLLHTWSLAVEEQFYIGLPILLLLVHRFAGRWLKPVLVVVALLSFAACAGLQWFRPTATFFLSPFRAWELLLGALLAVGFVPVVSHRGLREALAAGALALLVGSIALIEPGLAFPGWRAALPAVATAMLLWTGASGDTAVGRLLQVRPLVWFGLISYSLYLWHWPVIVFARYRSGLEPLGALRWPLLALAVLLAWLSYRFVEQPFRRKRADQTSALVLRWGLAGTLLLAAAGALLRLRGGWAGRFPAEVVALDRERQPTIPFFGCIDQPMAAIRRRDICRVGAAVEPTVLVWGDSHSLAWIPAIDSVLKVAGVSAFYAGRSACPPLIGVRNPVNPQCLDHNLEMAAVLRAAPRLRLVVLAASWLSYSVPDGQYRIERPDGVAGNAEVFAPALRSTVAALRGEGRIVWILGPVPWAPGNPPLRMALASMVGRPVGAIPPRPVAAFRDEARHFYDAVAALPPDSLVLVTDPAPWLCDARSCRYEEGGLPLYRDSGHLNVRGAAYVTRPLAEAFAPLLHRLTDVDSSVP